MRINNKKSTKNDSNQVTVTGNIVTTEEHQLRNTSNDGMHFGDKGWDHYSTITLPAGETVDYTAIETYTGTYHTISTEIVVGEKIIKFAKTVKGNK